MNLPENLGILEMTNYYKKEDDSKWVDFKERLQVMKDSVDARLLLESLGFKITRETTKELRGPCIIHGGDNTTAFRFNKEKKSWICFSHKCHDFYGSDVISLICAVLKCDFLKAVDYLKGMTGEVSNDNYYRLKTKQERESFIHSYDNAKISPSVVNETTLKDFKSMRTNYFVNTGIKPETLESFEIGGGYIDNEGVVREVIPIRNDHGLLLAYSLRDIRKNISDKEYDNKYVLTPGFEKDTVLYNMNKAKEYGSYLPIIVVEGFKSVWKLYECGIKNVVATIGSSVTEGQCLLLCSYALKGAIIMFDNDKPGINGLTKACEDLKDKLDVIPVYITETDEFGKGLDPADLSCKQLYEYLDTYF